MIKSSGSIYRAATSAAVALLLVGAAAVPSEAAFFHRNSDGQQLIDPLFCLSDYQVRQAVAAQGFTNIFLNAPIDTHIQVRATQGKWVYLIDFNRCSGSIVSVQKLRPA